VVSNVQALLGSEQSLLTARQNQFVALVTLIEDLGGGWDSSQLGR